MVVCLFRKWLPDSRRRLWCGDTPTLPLAGQGWFQGSRPVKLSDMLTRVFKNHRWKNVPSRISLA